MSSFVNSTASSSTTPSTTHKGLFVPFIEALPLTLITGAVPKVPETFSISTPATCPCKPLDISATPSSVISSCFNLTAEPVNYLLLIF